MGAYRIRLADAVRAVGASREAIRHWLRRLPLRGDTPSGGWGDFSVIDIATLAIVAKLIDFGMKIEEAGTIATSVVGSTGDLTSLDGKLLFVWFENGKWNHSVRLMDESSTWEVDSFITIVLPAVVGRALDRLK